MQLKFSNSQSIIVRFLAVSLFSLNEPATPCFAQILPIKPARTIAFDTDEASYMDVDLSPDGKTVVFDILGDIYTMPATGGEARQLTRGLASNRRPTWSPDGKYISYISDRSGTTKIAVMNADGTCPRTIDDRETQTIAPRNMKLHQSKMPLWLSQNHYIAVGKNLYQLSGGNFSLRLTGRKDDIQFSPDGKVIYYRDNKGMEKMSLDSNSVFLLALLPNGSDNAQISPDAHWLVYISKVNRVSVLRVRNLMTSEDHPLASSIEKDRAFTEHYCFTPDSKAIIIGFRGKIHRIDINTGHDQSIPFLAHVKIDLGPLDYHTFRVANDSIHVAYTRSANASPDGKHLVFSALDQIYTMDLPDGRPKRLASQDVGQFQPIYSPDGEWIAYVSWNDKAGGFVWRVSAHGGRPQLITTLSGYYQHPAWSPDGSQIAVIKQNPRKFSKKAAPALGKLQVMNSSGGQARTLVDSISGDNEISFTSDGKSIIFMRNSRQSNGNEKPVPQLYAVQVSNPNQRVLAVSTTKSANTGIKQITVAPNGRYLVYRLRDNLYLVPVSGLNEPMPIIDDQQTLPVFLFARGGIDPHWEQGGDIISWSYGNHFYRVRTGTILAKAANDSSLVPDQTITINLNEPVGHSQGTIALHNARIITMEGDSVIPHGTIIIKNGRFSEIGPISLVKIPKGITTYEMAGKTIIPGLIDLHDHLHLNLDVFPQQSWACLADLAYGVTTARDPSSSYESFGYAELLGTGRMLGPRLFQVGVAITDDFNPKCLEDAREVVRERAMLGAVAIKQYLLSTRLQKQWLMMASSEFALNMTNEGETDDPNNYFAMIKDGSTGIEHNDTETWGYVYRDVTTLLAKAGTWLTPTLLVGTNDAFPYYSDYYHKNPDRKIARFWPVEEQDIFNSISKVGDTSDLDFVGVSATDANFRHHGMMVTMGSHGNLAGIGTQFEMWAMQKGGLTNLETLQAATIHAAEGLGMQDDLGSIKKGKIADLLVLDRNPLEDIHNTSAIHFVMKDGEIFDAETLKEVWPVKKNCPAAFRLRGAIEDSNQ